MAVESTRKVSGVVTSHDVHLYQDRETREITLNTLGKSKKSLQLRYTLPNGERIPVDVGDAITIYAHRPEAKEGVRSFTSLLVTQNDRWIFLLSEQSWVPLPESNPRLRIVGDGDSSFVESGRIQGLCEAVKQERVLLFEWDNRRYKISPGAQVIIPSDSGDGQAFTLIENSQIMKAQCPINPKTRRSFFMVSPPQGD